MNGAAFSLQPSHARLSFGWFRSGRLLENGCSEAEIHSATIKAAKTRKERMDTINEIKQKVRALMAEGNVSEAKNEDVDQQRYVASPVPSANRSPGLTPSPIISRKSPMRTTGSGPSPATRLAHLRIPSSPERGFLSPRCHIRLKRSVPIDLGNDLFSMDSVRYDPFDDRAARICSPKQQACSSPRSFLSAQQHMPPIRRDASPIVDTRPPIQPRRLASPAGGTRYSPRQEVSSGSSAPRDCYWSSTGTCLPPIQRVASPVMDRPTPMEPRRFASAAPIVLFQPPTLT